MEREQFFAHMLLPSRKRVVESICDFEWRSSKSLKLLCVWTPRTPTRHKTWENYSVVMTKSTHILAAFIFKNREIMNDLRPVRGGRGSGKASLICNPYETSFTDVISTDWQEVAGGLQVTKLTKWIRSCLPE